MIINDATRQFYRLLQSKASRVLVLVSYDVDAIAACKIIQFLLEADNIQYTVIPIATISDLVKSYREHAEGVKFVLFLNLGGSFDCVELLQPENDVTFFICDSHRTIDVYNVYRDTQVRVITLGDSEESGLADVPKYEQMFNEEYDNYDEDGVDLTRMSLEQLEWRRQYLAWKNERKRLLFEYTQFSFYAHSTALIMFDLAWKLSKDNNELLWLAIVGVSDQIINAKISKSRHSKQCRYLREAMNRLKNIRGDGGILSVLNGNEEEGEGGGNHLQSQSNHLSITYEKDLQLNLYRHWSIYESLRHTMYVACKFKIWKLRGHKYMLGFLAKLGLPLSQCKQKFSSMDLELRNNMKEWMTELSEEFSLSHIIESSFIANRSFKHKYSANDVAFASRALLESADKDKRKNQKFFDSIDSLSWKNIELLETGMDLAKVQLTAILKQVQSLLDSHQIHVSQSRQFMYVIIEESVPDANLFCSPGCLNALARFLLHAHASANPKNKRCYQSPLVLITPDVFNTDMALAIGVPPLNADSSKNFFSKAFIQVNQRMNACNIEPDMVDLCVVHLPFSERNNFLDQLSVVLG